MQLPTRRRRLGLLSQRPVGCDGIGRELGGAEPRLVGDVELLGFGVEGEPRGHAAARGDLAGDGEGGIGEGEGIEGSLEVGDEEGGG